MDCLPTDLDNELDFDNINLLSDDLLTERSESYASHHITTSERCVTIPKVKLGFFLKIKTIAK